MFKRYFNKFIAAILALILGLSLLPAMAAGKLPTEQEFANKVLALQKEFPAYQYWANANGKITAGRYRGSSKVGSSGCYDVSSKCGTFAVEGRELGWQCRGYVLMLADKMFGCCTHNDDGEWSFSSYSKGSYSGKYYAGDLVKLKMNSGREHWIFVYKVTSDKIYYSDCNRVGKCQIDWKSESKSTIRSKTIGLERYKGNTLLGTASPYHTLTVKYNANGGTIPGSDVKDYKYKVTTDSGLNLRSTAAENGTKLATLPMGTVFSVGKTTEADGYTWGQTTYSGKTGWCVISESWTSRALVPVTDYYLSTNGQVYKSANAAVYQQKMNQGTSYPNGFSNASSFGLVREGYQFIGWSQSASGGTIYDQNAAFKPEEIIPSLKDADKTITLYAVWRSTGENVSALPYIDVREGDWFYTGVEFAHQQGLMKGTTTNTFDPNSATTRAMLVTILYRLEGRPEVEQESGFSDVAAGSWYADAVCWAAQNNIVSGTGEGKFSPDAPISRAQMATILFRYAQSCDKAGESRDDLSGFADAEKTPEWAKEGLQWAVSNGLLAGAQNGAKLELLPEGGATRAQIASVLMRYIQNVQ